MTRKFAFVIPFLAALFAVGCSDHKTPAAQAPEVVHGLQVVQVQRTTVPDYVDAVGTVRALQTSQLSAQVVGAIVSIRAQEGQRVRKGEVLIVLDDAQQRAALQRASAAVSSAQQEIAAADADYALANSTLGRYQNLYEKKSVSPHEMDEVQARAKSASARRDQKQAGVAQARAMESEARTGLNYTRIRAPFDGVVTAKQVDVGTLASPGMPLLTLEDTHRFRLEASVDEGDIRLIKMGATAPVTVDGVGTELQGKIVEIVPAADPASRSFMVKLELPSEPRLHSGFFGRVRFPRGERDAIMVPRTAVLDHGQLHGVYVVGADGQIALRFVTVGKPAGDNIELLSGVTAGERLVASHGGRELAGKKVAN
jgi:RND family efflux transporter MFP subunit